MLCYDMIWIVRSLRPNDFWYGTKCCTELSAAMRATSRIRTSHLLSPYICESYEAYGRFLKDIICEVMKDTICEIMNDIICEDM